MRNSIQKNIDVQLTEEEVVNISQAVFKNLKNHISVINWQVNQLYNSNLISVGEVNTINDILSKVLKKNKT